MGKTFGKVLVYISFLIIFISSISAFQLSIPFNESFGTTTFTNVSLCTAGITRTTAGYTNAQKTASGNFDYNYSCMLSTGFPNRLYIGANVEGNTPNGLNLSIDFTGGANLYGSFGTVFDFPLDLTDNFTYYCQDWLSNRNTYFVFGDDSGVKFSLGMGGSAGNPCVATGSIAGKCCNLASNLCESSTLKKYTRSFEDLKTDCSYFDDEFLDLKWFAIDVLANIDYSMVIDDITFTLLNGTNEVPFFNISVPSTVCINDTTRTVNINITINATDPENDTIYYAIGSNIFDNGLFFTEFDLADCSDVDIYDINNEIGGFFQASYNEMGNGVTSNYLDSVRRCIIKLDHDSYNSTVGGVTFDKSILFNLEETQSYEPDILFKTQFITTISKLNILFTNTFNNVYNNLTIERNESNNLRLSSNGTFLIDIYYDEINFTQWKFKHTNNQIQVIECDDFLCNSENITVTINDTIINSKFKYLNLIIVNDSIYLDDFIISTETIGNFTTSKPNNITLTEIGTKFLRVWVSDNMNRPNNYRQEVKEIHVLNEDFCILGTNVLDNTKDCFYDLKEDASIFESLLSLLQFPYGLLCLFSLTALSIPAGVIAIGLYLFSRMRSGEFELQRELYVLFALSTLFTLMKFFPVGIYILIVLILGFLLGKTIAGGE